MASRLIRNQLPGNRLRVRVPCPPLYAKPPTQPVGGFCFALLKQEGIPLESKHLASVSQLTILFSFV